MCWPAVADAATYFGLFAIALAAATILPLQSEAALAALILAGQHSVPALIAVASAGNIAGSSINWFLGRYIERLSSKSWFPASADGLHRAQGWYAQYGKWSLLLSWAPFIGDPLTIAAGLMREPFTTFLILVAIAKIGRYLVLAAVIGALM